MQRDCALCLALAPATSRAQHNILAADTSVQLRTQLSRLADLLILPDVIYVIVCILQSQCKACTHRFLYLTLPCRNYCNIGYKMR